jgi:hypothetical protein
LLNEAPYDFTKSLTGDKCNAMAISSDLIIFSGLKIKKGKSLRKKKDSKSGLTLI